MRTTWREILRVTKLANTPSPFPSWRGDSRTSGNRRSPPVPPAGAAAQTTSNTLHSPPRPTTAGRTISNSNRNALRTSASRPRELIINEASLSSAPHPRLGDAHIHHRIKLPLHLTPQGRPPQSPERMNPRSDVIDQSHRKSGLQAVALYNSRKAND